MFGGLRNSFERIWAHPQSLIAALELQLAEVLAFAVLWVTSVELPWSLSTTVPVVVYHAAVALVVPLFYGLTVASLRDGEDPTTLSTTAARTWKALGVQRLLVVGSTAVLAFALLSLALTLDTGLVLSGLRGGASVFGDLPFAILPVAVALGLAYLLAPASMTYAFELAATGRSAPREAWRDALRFGRQSPGAALRGVLFDAVLLTVVIVGLRGILAVVPADPRPDLLAVMALALLPLLAVLRAWRASYRLELVAANAPALPDTDPEPLRTRLPTRPTARQVLAVVLVVALLAGVATVRVADIRPREPAEPTPVDIDDPQAAFAAEQELRATRSHSIRTETRTRNETTGRIVHGNSRRVVYDMQDWEFWKRSVGDDYDPDERFVHLYYHSEGVIASCLTCASDGRWSGHAGPGVVRVGPGTPYRSVYPDPSADWQVVRQNASHVTFGMADPAASDLARAYEAGLRPGSYVRATFERRTGWLVSIEHRLRFEATEDEGPMTRSRRFVVRRTGPDPVQRPEPVGWQGPFELLWDLAYY